MQGEIGTPGEKRPLPGDPEESTPCKKQAMSSTSVLSEEQLETAKQQTELAKKLPKKLPAQGPLSNGDHIVMVGDELHTMSSKGFKRLREENMIFKKEVIWVCSPELLREAGYYDWDAVDAKND